MNKLGLGLAAFFAAALPLTPLTAQSAVAQEIIVTVERVRALDVIDAASPADFVARITIGNQTIILGPIKDQNDIRPKDWIARHRVSAGDHPVKIEILDKDVALNDKIDINRVDQKRDLDFTVNTGSCTISGFSQAYRCGNRIVRGGAERKKAEITFKVDVR